MTVVCKWCHRAKVRAWVTKTGDAMLCTGCDFGPTGMAGLPVAERVKEGPK